MGTDLHSRTELLLDRGTKLINRSVSLIYGGRWKESVTQSFRSARFNLAAVLLSCGMDPRRMGLARMIHMIERETGSKAPSNLLINARRLDRVFLQLIRNTAGACGWSDYPDEEMSADMLHVSRLIARYCRAKVNRFNSRNGSLSGEE